MRNTCWNFEPVDLRPAPDVPYNAKPIRIIECASHKSALTRSFSPVMPTVVPQAGRTLDVANGRSRPIDAQRLLVRDLRILRSPLGRSPRRETSLQYDAGTTCSDIQSPLAVNPARGTECRRRDNRLHADPSFDLQWHWIGVAILYLSSMAEVGQRLPITRVGGRLKKLIPAGIATPPRTGK
jgi:hypothetical protein